MSAVDHAGGDQVMDDGISIIADRPHRIERVDPERYVKRAVDIFATTIQSSVRSRGRCTMAVSGGSTPGPVFTELARRALPWHNVTIFQVDERIAPEGSAERNLTVQREAFDGRQVQWVPLPIGDDRAASVARIGQFESELRGVAGDPPILDIVHLGMGGDGHTASLIPGDPIIDETERLVVATTEPYQGTHRLTMTRPVLDRARLVLWLIRGADKAGQVEQLLAFDESIPAGMIRPRRSLVLTDF